jgi:Suppressor of fused protein (SUFU)
MTEVPTAASMNEVRRAALDRHLAEHLGGENWVFHEIVSDTVHVDLLIFEPTDTRPYRVVVTAGMSDLPLPDAEDADLPRYAEVYLALPPEWPMDRQRWISDEDSWWPMRLLKIVARFPHEVGVPIGAFETLALTEPPTQFASGTALCGILLATPIMLPEGFGKVAVEDAEPVVLYSVIPLHSDELAAVRTAGPQVLFEGFDRDQVSELLDARRTSVLRE